jgi:hypothetical protein
LSHGNARLTLTEPGVIDEQVYRGRRVLDFIYDYGEAARGRQVSRDDVSSGPAAAGPERDSLEPGVVASDQDEVDLAVCSLIGERFTDTGRCTRRSCPAGWCRSALS